PSVHRGEAQWWLWRSALSVRRARPRCRARARALSALRRAFRDPPRGRSRSGCGKWRRRGDCRTTLTSNRRLSASERSPIKNNLSIVKRLRSGSLTSGCDFEMTMQPAANRGPVRRHLLHMLNLTTHSPDFVLSQLAIAARRAASWVVRQAAPMCLRSSVVARAEHCFAPLSMTTLQPPAPQRLSATSLAFAAVRLAPPPPPPPRSLSHANS